MKRLVYMALLCCLPALSCAGSNKDSVETESDVSIISTKIDNLSKEVDNIEITVQDAKEEINKLMYIMGILEFVIIVVAVIILVMLYKKNNKNKGKTSPTADMPIPDANKRNGQEDVKALQGQVQNLEQMVADMRDHIIHIEREIRELHMCNAPQPSYPTPEPEIQQAMRATREPTPQNVKKYASFTQDINGQMSINEWDLVDDPSGQLFEISFDKDRANATFVINQGNVGNMLCDLPNLRNYANDFDAPPVPKGIKVTEPGTLKRSGDVWVMNRKMTIEIV